MERDKHTAVRIRHAVRAGRLEMDHIRPCFRGGAWWDTRQPTDALPGLPLHQIPHRDAPTTSPRRGHKTPRIVLNGGRW